MVDQVCPGMTRIIADMPVSLDGFVTGPDPGPDNGLGTGGEALHTWAFSDAPDDRRILPGDRPLGRSRPRPPPLRRGRRAERLGEVTGYGVGEVGKPASVVVTSSPPGSVRTTSLDWTFVTTGLPDALTAARERAQAASPDSGKDLDVVLKGGGTAIGSALDAGLVDALSVHLGRRAGHRDTAVHRRSAAHAGAAERDLDIDRDAPDLRRPRGDPMTIVNANEVALGIESFGDDDAPLVLLAGGTTMLSWPDALCERLAGRGRRVVRYDLRDSGESTTADPQAPAYTLRDLAADAAALADALGGGPAHLAGVGVGGMVAQVAVLDHPGAFSALTWSAPARLRPARPTMTSPAMTRRR